MANPITVLAVIKLAPGRTEADLLEASEIFQQEFASRQPGLIRRELVRKSDGEYLDIVQFRSMENAMATIEKEKESSACHAFFAVMDLEGTDESDGITFCQSLATYGSDERIA